MFFKKAILAAAFAMGASASFAATCDVSCSISNELTVDDQKLSNGVLVSVDSINPGVAGAFTYTGSFIQDTEFNGESIATFSIDTLQGVTDLTLNILSPVGIAASYALTANVAQDVVLTAPGLVPEYVVGFSVTGATTDGIAGGEFNLHIAAVPLPAGVLLMGTALAGFGVLRRRKKAA